MQGHIRSILPQRGGVAPVDSDTIFFAPYDKDTKDTLRGIKPIGSESALGLNGVSDFIETGSSALGDMQNSLSAEAWVFYRGGDRGGIISGVNNFSFLIEIISSTSFRVRLWNSSGTGTDFTVSSVPLLNTWNHIAFSYDGTSVNVFVNGVKRLTSAYSQTLRVPSSIEIGRYAPSGTNIYLNAIISSCRVWSRGLSDEEVKKSMLGSTDEMGEPILFLRLNEGEGAIAFDYSGRGNDGIIRGGSWGKGILEYSMKKEGVLVEEGTTNMVSGSALIFENGWGAFGGAAITRTQNYSFMEFNTNKATRFQTSGGTGTLKAVYQIICNTTAGNTYTSQIKIKNIGTHNFRLKDQYGQNELFRPGEWRHVTKTITHSGSSCFQFRFETDNIADPIDVVVYEPQAEQKPYATSFVEGERKDGVLKYPTKIENPATISFWLKPMVPDNFSSHVNWVLGEEPYSNNLLMWKRTSENYYRVRIGSSDVEIAQGDISFEQWSHVAIVAEPNQFSVYVNGQLSGTKSSILTPIEILTVGYADGQNAGTNIFDELRIDKVARSAEEIRAWYYQGRNGG